ncbi:MAG: fumarate hydratase C-terminal domain-containing protein [Kiritimatiellae bacterium]|nr:fumarate hydratase C-terminal domain-containing protein [Kiritimatiellia bacterium]
MAAVRLRTPLAEADVRALRAGDEVLLSGRVHTGRDRFHKAVFESGECPVDLAGGALFHCGPVVVPDAAAPGGWRVVAAGPTTSCREEPYMAAIVERHGLRAIVGKGGMGEATRGACRRFGCVYLQAVGGAAALLARCVKRVAAVHFLDEFGATEACWSLDVEDLPLLVGMDASGRSLYAEVEASSRSALDALLAGKEPPK